MPLLLVPAPAGAIERDDPFPLRNQLVLHLLFLDQTPRGARLLAHRQTRLTASLAYESTHAGSDALIGLFENDDFATFDGLVTQPILEAVAASTPDQSAYFLDGEILRAVIDFAVGIGPRFEIGLEAPVLLHTSGIFDSTIDRYHEAFGLPDAGRPAFARNRFVAGYVDDGESVFVDGPPGGADLGDIVLSARTQLSSGTGRWPAVAAGLSIKAPTGDAERLAGSGSTDYGLGLQVSRRFGRSTLNGSFAYTFIGEWALAPKLPLEDSRSLLGGYAFNWTDRTTLIGQILLTSGPFPKRSGSDLGSTAAEISLGARHRLRAGDRFEWGVIENLTTDHNTPDIGLFFGCSFVSRPGSPPPAPEPRR